ncbi:MAG: translation initiation factor IF-2 [Pirellulaceae bacterium]|nr:translation initiation factor IF-2 [Pirellulaceae bacterium]
MPIRIYALAKDLKIDSKELVDFCTKAGIPGKGSALASLEDDEVIRLRAYMEGASAKKSAATPAPLVDTKAVLSSPVAGTATLPPPPPPPPKAPPRRTAPVAPPPAETPAPAPANHVAAEVAAPEVAPPPPPPQVRETSPPSVAAQAAEFPVAASKPPMAPPSRGSAPAAPSTPPSRTPGPVKPPAPPTPPAELSPVRGDSFVSRRGSGIKILDTKTKKPAERSRDGEPPKTSDRRAPGVRFAAMPEVKQPSPSAKAAEPKAQKPLLKLPTDVLKGKTNRAAPLQALAEKVERERKQKESGVKTGKVGAGDAAGLLPGRGGKKRGRPGAGEEPGLADMASVRADRNKGRKGKGRPGGEEDEGPQRKRRNLVRMKKHGSTAAPRKDKATLEMPCNVRSFSEAAGVSAAQVIRSLMGMGLMVNINAHIPDDYVELLVAEFGVDLDFKAAESLEEKVLAQFAAADSDESLLEPRPPIVTVLGHVDHGKTSLLDKIIGSNVVAGEAGGITQHIRAYLIPTKDGRHVSFVDTPGHEAFTEMRARGANVTDIAVLVVAADDGVMPQTEEAISHAKAAGVPIVVAMNKIDLPSADEQKVLQQLATAGLLPSEWGGDVEVVRTSAVTGQGIDTLLETLLVTAELHEYKANAQSPASGMCLEAEQEAGRGVIAKLMVQSGTLREGDIVVCGAGHGRVKAMFDTLRPRQKIKVAGPSTPVNVTGLDVAPNAGDRFYVLSDISQARELAGERALASRQQSLSGISTRVSFEDFQQRLSEGRLGQSEDVTVLNLIIRADVRGSIEAIQKELAKLDHPEVKIRVLQASVGGITVADVTLASASNAVIAGFNVIPDEAARNLADERQVEIRRYDIIYKLTDDIKALLEGKLKPEERVVDMGAALVKQVFTISRVGAVAGCLVIRGSIERGCRVRVNRDSRTIGDYAIDSLRREKDDAKEVARGMECGIKLAGFNDLKEGDLLEAYKIEEVARTL